MVIALYSCTKLNIFCIGTLLKTEDSETGVELVLYAGLSYVCENVVSFYKDFIYSKSVQTLHFL